MVLPPQKMNRNGFKNLDEFRKICTVFPTMVQFEGSSIARAVIRKYKVSLGHQINHKNQRELKVWADINSISPSEYKASVAEIYSNFINNDGLVFDTPTIQEFYEDTVVPLIEASLKDSKGFKKHMQPLLENYGGKTLTEFQKQWASLLILELAQTVSSPTQARYLARWTRFFNLAIERDHIDSNPCKGIPKPKENPPRDRVPSLPEINALTKACLADFNPIHSGCILFCLFSGLRQGSVRGIKLSWFNDAYSTLSIPDSKNGKPIYMDLNSVAQSIVKRVLPYTDGAYLFPSFDSSSANPKHMGKPTKCFSRLVASVQAATGITEHFHCHDLRRAYSSYMLRLSGDIRLCQQALGHADITTTQRYAYHSNPELLAASEQTAAALLGGRSLEDFNPTMEK
jgi:integrase